MYCNICGKREDNIRIFRISMCRECFYEFANISPDDENYDKYKNLIRIILSYYIGSRPEFYPVN